jgi:CheY-like chemotaxis protein
MDKNFRILIADDDNRWADYCARKLCKYKDNIDIEVSYTVDDSLQKIEDHLYDLIFCDYKMEYQDASGVPHEDGGFRICGKSKNYPQIKVIMVTAYGSSDLARTSLVDEKFDDYLEKAEDPEADVTRMRKFIAKLVESWDEQAIASNPFHAQLGQPPKHLIANRKESLRSEMDFLADCIKFSEQNNLARFLLLGQWGMGKSCLLLHYKNYLQKRGYLCSYCKIPPEFSADSAMDAASALLINIIDGFPGIKRVSFSKFFESANKMGLKISAMGLGGNVEWERQQKKVVPYTLLAQGLNSLYEDLRNQTDIVAILLDDLQNLDAFPEVLNSLLHILSEPEFVKKPILLGASLLTDPSGRIHLNIQNEQVVTRFFAGYKLSLTRFASAEIHELTLQTLGGTGVVFEENVINEIYNYTKGHPFAVQLLSHYLYESQISGVVKMESFKKAMQNSVLELSPFFQYLYGDQTGEEKALIHMIANQETVGMKGLQHLLIENDMGHLIANASQICSRLLEKSIIKKDDSGVFQIADELFKEYLLNI